MRCDWTYQNKRCFEPHAQTPGTTASNRVSARDARALRPAIRDFDSQVLDGARCRPSMTEESENILGVDT